MRIDQPNTNIGRMDEGIRFVHPKMPVIRRSQKIDLLMSALEEDRVVLIRSTPGTGKTSTLQLLEDRLDTAKVLHGTLNMLDAGLVNVDASNENGNSSEFNQYCANTLGDHWKTLFDKKERYVLLIRHRQYTNTMQSISGGKSRVVLKKKMILDWKCASLLHMEKHRVLVSPMLSPLRSPPVACLNRTFSSVLWTRLSS